MEGYVLSWHAGWFAKSKPEFQLIADLENVGSSAKKPVKIDQGAQALGWRGTMSHAAHEHPVPAVGGICAFTMISSSKSGRARSKSTRAPCAWALRHQGGGVGRGGEVSRGDDGAQQEGRAGIGQEHCQDVAGYDDTVVRIKRIIIIVLPHCADAVSCLPSSRRETLRQIWLLKLLLCGRPRCRSQKPSTTTTCAPNVPARADKPHRRAARHVVNNIPWT